MGNPPLPRGTVQDALLASRLAVGGLLILTGLAKQLDRAGFREDITRYGLVPPRLVPSVAIAVIIAELGLGVSLLLGVGIAVTAFLAAALLAVFTASVSAALKRGERIPCGCFGNKDADLISLRTVVRNASLMVLAATIGWSALTNGIGFLGPLVSPSGNEVSGREFALVALIGLVAASAWQLLNASTSFVATSHRLSGVQSAVHR
jgi:uncharacterized membrane protein YphA (DoxX/SURF4 family)